MRGMSQERRAEYLRTAQRVEATNPAFAAYLRARAGETEAVLAPPVGIERALPPEPDEDRQARLELGPGAAG